MRLCRQIRARRGERGAAVVEAALALPVLFLLIFGIMETGSLLRSYTTVSNGARAGGRAASVAGSDAMADQYVLRRMQAELSGMDIEEIEYIAFWHSDGPGPGPNQGLPSAACRPTTFPAVPNATPAGQRVAGGGVGSCNLYYWPAEPGGAFAMADPDTTDGASLPPETYFGCASDGEPMKVDCNWRPGERRVLKSPRGGAGTLPDYFGVYVRAKHSTVTGILGDTFTITDQAVYLLEPQGYANS